MCSYSTLQYIFQIKTVQLKDRNIYKSYYIQSKTKILCLTYSLWDLCLNSDIKIKYLRPLCIWCSVLLILISFRLYDGALNADFLTTATTDHMYDQIKKKVRKMYCKVFHVLFFHSLNLYLNISPISFILLSFFTKTKIKMGTNNKKSMYEFKMKWCLI